jgi:hypothetical protein
MGAKWSGTGLEGAEDLNGLATLGRAQMVLFMFTKFSWILVLLYGKQ